MMSEKLISLSIRLVCLYIVGGILVISSANCWPSDNRTLDEHAEKEFRQLVGPAIWDSGFQLLSEPMCEYNGRISILAVNNSRHRLWFPSQDLGMKAFQFRKERKAWEQVVLPEQWFANPGPLELHPRPTEPYGQLYGFDAQRIAGTKPRKVRFLAVGVNGTNKHYAAYVDIEIGGIPEKDVH